ncbi:MAG: thiamine-phosphate pyrophosphorylase [Elusimicrobia bacterium]|nr:thiamine-phosphate pyrophosphorylase [Elusimicrobiota bacterium]
MVKKNYTTNFDLLSDKKAYRLFDANLNRAKEGLRVIEDTARFIFDKQKLYKNIRSLRHKIDKLTRKIYPELVGERNSKADPGRKIKEGKRKNLEAILIANFKRVEESLRVLEEYSRLIYPSAGPGFKSARFSVYLLEKKVLNLNAKA